MDIFVGRPNRRQRSPVPKHLPCYAYTTGNTRKPRILDRTLAAIEGSHLTGRTKRILHYRFLGITRHVPWTRNQAGQTEKADAKHNFAVMFI